MKLDQVPSPGLVSEVVLVEHEGIQTKGPTHIILNKKVLGQKQFKRIKNALLHAGFTQADEEENVFVSSRDVLAADGPTPASLLKDSGVFAWKDHIPSGPGSSHRTGERRFIN